MSDKLQEITATSPATTNGLTTTYLANTVNEYTSITGSPAPPMYDNNGNALSYPVLPIGSFRGLPQKAKS